MSIKCVTIKDYMKVPYKDTFINAPVSKIALSVNDLRYIMHSEYPPVHIYAIDPKDSTNMIALTKKNYMLSNDELFNVTEAVKEPVVVAEEKVEEKEEVDALKSLFNDASEKEEINEIAEPSVEDTIEETTIDTENDLTVSEGEPKDDSSTEEPVIVAEEQVEEKEEVDDDSAEESNNSSDNQSTQKKQYQNSYNKKNNKKKR